MQGLRIFERFGFKLPKATPKESKVAKITTEFQEWHFVPEYFDWLNSENELTLTGYYPNIELKHLLEKTLI